MEEKKVKKLLKILLLSALSIFLVAGSAMALTLDLATLDTVTRSFVSDSSAVDDTYTKVTKSTIYNTDVTTQLPNANGYVLAYNGDFVSSPAYDVLISVKLNPTTTFDSIGDPPQGAEYNLRPVPEPASMLLLGTGLICLAGFTRKLYCWFG